MGIRDLVEPLLFEEEGSALDFKREQYKFVNETSFEKSELLKDILAFANSWRREHAYILIGVEEVKGGRSIAKGVSHHIDDASLQQFVNSKTNRPVQFSYIATELDGCQIALIQIPVQQRPLYLRNDFGSLKKDVVYLRRGSATDVASPDEVAQMGKEAVQQVERLPILSAFIVGGQHNEALGKKMGGSVIALHVPDGTNVDAKLRGAYDFVMAEAFGKNLSYYSEYAAYLHEHLLACRFRLAVRNLGNSVAKDVKLVLTFSDCKEKLTIFLSDDLPDKPNPNRNLLPILARASNSERGDISVAETSNGWRASCSLGKIQAKDLAITTNVLCVAPMQTQELTISAEIFCDDLSSPVAEPLSIEIALEHRDLSIDELIRVAQAGEFYQG